MYKQLILIPLSLFSILIQAQSYFQQQADYYLNVELIPSEERIKASGNLVYTNNSSNSLNEIYLHIWANSYSSDESEFAKQQIRIGQTKFHFRDNVEPYGYRILNLTQGVRELSYSDHEGHPDVIKVNLEDAVGPGESITIDMEFELKVPPFFSRMGAEDGYFQVTQWFPKPAVYDKNGWHPMPYLDLGEFYSEFGKYEVDITVPEDYVVAATGLSKTPTTGNGGKKTYSFKADKVHDFAWCAYNNFTIKEGQVTLSNGDEVLLYVYEVDEYQTWNNSLEFLEQAVLFYSENVGPYPYPQATVVQSPGGTGGGMEYPMLTTIDTEDSEQSVDHVIAHEVGHNWFYGILATNERTDAWMDEGMNSFFDHKYNDQYYDSGTYDSVLPKFFRADSTRTFLEKTVVWQCKRGRNQACRVHSNDMNSLNYGFGAYEYPAWSFKYLEDYLGEQLFDKCIKSYYEEWQFKHPQPEDLKEVFYRVSDQNLDWFFEDLLGKAGFVDHSIGNINNENVSIINKGQLNIPVRLDFKKDGEWVGHQWTEVIEDKKEVLLSIQDFDEVYINGASPFMDVNPRDNHKGVNGKSKAKSKLKLFASIDDPERKEIFWLPSLTWNFHSKAMLGLHVYNSSFPQKKTRLYGHAGYSFAENSLSWIGNLEQDFMLESPRLRKLTAGINHRKFSKRNSLNLIQTDDGYYYRTSPFLRLYFEPDYKNRKDSWLTYNYIHLQNQIFSDVILIDEKENNHFHELSYNLEKKSALKPFDLEVKAMFHRYDSVNPDDEPDQFLRLSTTFKGKLKYSKKSSFSYRIFAGFFPINTNREVNSYNNDLARGSLNLSYNSFADVSYGDYWLGRQVQDHWTEKQFLYEQGGFKTPLIYNNGNLGKSNNALFTANFKSDIPIPIFRVIPIKPYADFGIYSTPRQSGVPGAGQDWNFDYGAGFALEFLDGAFGIYFPLLQSERIQQVYDSEELVRKVSFQFDLRKLKPWDLIDRLEM